MTLAASSWYATNAWQQNTLPGRIRVWTKDANQNRNPASVTNGGDFIPDGTHLPLSSIFASGTNRTVLYVEGIGTSSGWGTDKIHATVYPVPSLGTGIDDEVSYTVVRCVYKVCVTRPYICQSTWAWGWNTNYWISFPDYIQTVTNRTLFLTDYTTPSSMFSDWCEGMQSTNYDNDYHEKACAMGHAFARLEVRTPDHPAGTNLCGGWYHITTRGVRRREIFADDQDREHFVGLLEELVNRYGMSLDTVQSCVQRVRRHLPKDAALRRHHAKVLQVLADKKAE